MQCLRYARLTTRSSFVPLCDGYRSRTASYLGCIKVLLPLSFLCSFGFSLPLRPPLVSFCSGFRTVVISFFLCLYFTIPPPILGHFAPRRSTFVLYPDRRRCRFALTASPSSRSDRFSAHFAKYGPGSLADSQDHRNTGHPFSLCFLVFSCCLGYGSFCRPTRPPDSRQSYSCHG